ncbi:AAA family ATPase [Tardiphaga sp. OK245]|uniref:AAA family ATPase n=1 Tax=Tardiphaga sp. OK245 TaxID=1855306 RepID=UPI0008A7729B|nr:AAA family ATPase [Tardiphaga sp. OK245]SEI20896.1 Peptidase family M41 [Tardiphaga sp. OK245]
MTRKSFTKLQRSRAAAIERSSTTGAVSIQLLRPENIPSKMAAAPSLSQSASKVTDEFDSDDPEAICKLATKKTSPSARCSLVAAAFREATSGGVRRRLKDKTALALVVLVPRPSWIEPVRSLFVMRFGERWQAFSPDTMKTPQQRTERNKDVANYLTLGYSVVGVAVEREALPTALTIAADLTIRVNSPGSSTIGRAVRMFTGEAAPAEIGEEVSFGLEFYDLVAAFRANSSPAEIIGRLRKAAAATSGASTTESLPKLEEAIEYGAARTWGMALARDLADYRAGRLDWQDVDRGAVLFSEPGLGKSLFARILAQACAVPLVTFSIADLFASSPGYLDSVIKASRGMFERAAALAPCILFLDEIDALPNRATMSTRAQEWWTSVVTDFMLSLDNAVAGKRAGIVVIGATNNIKGVDAAVLRPGRLERAIEIRRPDHAGATNILRYHLNGEMHHVDLADIAHLIDGSTGAEIMMAVRSARRIARYAGRRLERDDLLQAIAPVEHIAPDALKRASVHEAAHAVASLVVRSGILKRCTVGTATASFGLTLIEMDQDDLLTRDSVERRAVVLLCARAAERLLIGNAGLGAGGDDESDLAQVTQFVATLHASSGLGDTLTYITSFKDALAAVRDDRELRSKVERHMQALQGRAEEIVHRYRDAIVAVADRLRTRRQLSGEEVRRIVEATPTNDQPELANR